MATATGTPADLDPGSGATDHRSVTSSGRTRSPPAWWKIHLFHGMANDIRRRAPYYWSDWIDAWDYRVIPATVYMYFANILPALAFSLDMFTKTHMQYGVNEVLLASVLGAIVFSIVACQPLVIVGVTGPITVFNYTVFDIITPLGTNYLAFMCWIGLWAVALHWILAITNSCNWLKYVTRFPCDIFGFYVAFIYLQKGIQVLERFSGTPFYLSLSVALLVFSIAYICGELGSAALFRHPVRIFLKDYGTPLTVIFFTGFIHLGRMKTVDVERLPTSRPFFPTADRPWLVELWDIEVREVFLALPFAILLTILFWFDHNVSSLIAQGTEFPLRKPAGFHWDIFLLGLTTGVAGILGLPFPNGLIPQAPFHTESLCVTVVEVDEDENNSEAKGHYTYKRTHVVEQRVSNLAQGLLTLGTATGPLLIVLHLIPQAVLAGLFFIMGYQALKANGITAKLLFLLRDKRLTPSNHPLNRIKRRSAVWGFVITELVGFGATFAITQTIAAVGFPIFIFALIPLRAFVMPRFFTAQELGILDEPTASPFTMESVGGIYGAADASEDAGHDDDDAGAGASSGILVSTDETGKSGERLAEEGRNGFHEKGQAGVESVGLSRRGRASGDDGV
ncbi:HCO3 transporter family-domain-containing protein [Xylaria intraflava]|nr:HCO3 transporter family-domain-containing protein [Xylaria intraflava]